MFSQLNRWREEIMQGIDFKGLYRDLLRALLKKAGEQKDIVVDVLAREIKTFLGKVNITDELQKALRGMTINLNASFDFQKKGGKLKVRQKRARIRHRK